MAEESLTFMPPPLLQLQRPWLRTYPQSHRDINFAPRCTDALSLFRHAVRQGPANAAIHYFDATLSYADLDALSDSFAGWLARSGIGVGDRVALFMQNIPQFVICLVGAWKLGACGVSINPMSRARELRLLLQDSGARVLVTQRDLYMDVARDVLAEFPAVIAVATSPRDFQGRNDTRLFAGPDEPPAHRVADLKEVLQEPVSKANLCFACGPDAAAMIVYTSGTTGVPKGAVVSHRNIAFEGDVWRSWIGARDGGPILAIAPLFHITGLGAHIALAFAAAAPLILAMRFHPEVMSVAAQEYRAEVVIGAITAFIALLSAPGVRPEQWQTVRVVCSGGAPVPAAVAAEFQQRFGLPVYTGYGLTETCSMVVATPPGMTAPIDANGALSVGLPAFETDVYVAGDAGQVLPVGEIGEIMLRGPQVVSGYWGQPKESAEAFFDGWLRTGDVGYMDADGWLFLVDRKKDMIIASGYKVWPKEVEEVLYTHPAVREAAVVGVPDSYRGETVKAVVSLKAEHCADAAELMAYCRERMAAYKQPRIVEFLPELPKTLTGKILRRELR